MVVRRVVFGVLGVQLALLVVTGVALFFWYRPTAAVAWDDVRSLHPAVALVHAIRLVHRWTATLMFPSAVIGAVVLAVQARRARLRLTVPVAIGAALVTAVLAAGITGYAVAWDQLALWAVTVGTNMIGFLPLFGDQVRFVLVNGVEVGTDTLLRWLAAHVALGLAIGGFLGALMAKYRHQRAQKPEGSLPM